MTTVTEMRHRGGYERPSDDEMQKLFDLVLTHRPELREGASFAEFPRAMLAVAHLGRTDYGRDQPILQPLDRGCEHDACRCWPRPGRRLFAARRDHRSR